MAVITIRAAVEAHRAALTASDPVDDLATPLHDVERAAWKDLVACPCLTPADVDAKLSYLLDEPRMRDWIADDAADPVALLQSLRLPVPPTMTGTSTSQHVNALFASYVATEAEQTRLGNLGTPEAGKEADALGKPALAIRDQVFAIRDRSACPDLVAARILLDLMLSHPWPPAPNREWGDAADIELPMLEILSSALTGAVREQARVALATIGVDVPAEEPTSIEAMAADLRAMFDSPSGAVNPGEEESDEPDRFETLRARIIDAEPKTPRDVALQFMADTHWNDMAEVSDRLAGRMAKLSNWEAT